MVNLGECLVDGFSFSFFFGFGFQVPEKGVCLEWQKFPAVVWISTITLDGCPR